MMSGLLNRKQAIASAMVVATLVVISALGASGAERQGMLKPKEVKALGANARTPSDHLRLARHFAAMAERQEAEAREHEALTEEYTRHPRLGSTKIPMAPNSPQHCRYFAERRREAAGEMRALAVEHEEMARNAGRSVGAN